MALAQDEATGAGRARTLDKLTSQGKVVYRSNFDAGFDGWTDHWDGLRPYPILSLTTEMQMIGNRCLMLSTGEETSPNAASVANGTAAFKRMVLHDEYRYHSLSAYVAIGVSGPDGTWSAFQLYIDTQNAASTKRSFLKAMCYIQPGPVYNKWKIRGDGGESDFKVVTAADGSKIGDNDNKSNMQYVRLTADATLGGAAGVMGYHSLQVGNQVFDLRGVGAGSSVEPPQTNGVDNISDFRRGFNIGFGLSRDITKDYGAQLFVDDVTYSVSNVA